MDRRAGFVAVFVAAVMVATVAVLLRSSDHDSEPARTSGVRFMKGLVEGTTTSRLTTLRFGPDGRLYAGQQNGIIRVFTLERKFAAHYRVTAGETIGLLVDLANHNDDGVENPAVAGRQLTGIEVAGTAEQPVIYAVTTDPRMGGGPSGLDLPIDTNSGVLSRLTRDGPAWKRTDLVRGLPRSKENHAGNGLALDSTKRRLFLAQGGHTNNGAPSKQFAFLPEYPLSGAILVFDLAALGDGTFDLPTADDPARPGPADAGDPFGGAGGANAARLDPTGPVTVYAPGFRNPYDVVVSHGRVYTIDNGANPGWGDAPRQEGDGGCSNEPRPGGMRQNDTFHVISAAPYYGGHPNPARGECRFLPGTRSGAVATFPASTNGLAEYRAGRVFGGKLAGDLLAASFDNRIYRLELGNDGRFIRQEILFEQVNQAPLDVTVQGDDEAFPGTVWVGDVSDGSITVFEPAD